MSEQAEKGRVDKRLLLLNEFFEGCIKENLSIEQILDVQNFYKPALYSYMNLRLYGSNFFKER